MSDTLLGLYPTLRSAEDVARSLMVEGVDPERIGMVTHRARDRYYELVQAPSERTTRDPVWGTLGGALVGAVVGALLSFMFGLVPGFDWILGSQASPSILGGAGVGALLGSAIGGLAALGGRRPTRAAAEANDLEAMLLVETLSGEAPRLEQRMTTGDLISLERTAVRWHDLGWQDIVPVTPTAVQEVGVVHHAEHAPRQIRPVSATANGQDLRRAAFQLGVLLAGNDRATDWTLAEPIARARWETGPYADTPFDRIVSHVRNGYETARAAPV